MDESENVEDTNDEKDNAIEENVPPITDILETDADIDMEGVNISSDTELGKSLNVEDDKSKDNITSTLEATGVDFDIENAAIGLSTNLNLPEVSDVLIPQDTDIIVTEEITDSSENVVSNIVENSVVSIGTDTDQTIIKASIEPSNDLTEDTREVIEEDRDLNIIESVTKTSEDIVAEQLEVDHENITPVVAGLIPDSTDHELISDNISLSKELIGKEVLDTTDKVFIDSYLQKATVQSIRSKSTSESEMITSPTTSQIVKTFVEDIIDTVQNIVDVRDEFNIGHSSLPSQFGTHPAESTVSDVEIPEVCCTYAETVLEQPVPIPRAHTGTSSLLENLAPDNPLMKRFQVALTAHLQRQKSRISGELLQMEGDLRQKKKEKEELTLLLYSIQQMLKRQHKSLDMDKETILQYFTRRQDVETMLKSEKQTHKEKTNLQHTERNIQANLQLEKDKLSEVLRQFTEMENSLNSELTISQMVSDANKANTKLMIRDRLKQDMLLVTLTSEVLRLSNMFTEMEKNIKDKQTDVQVLTQTVMNGNVDLEALEQENKRLMQAWKVVIFRIQQRDKAFIEMKEELQKVLDQYKGLECQIESYIRSAKGEMKCNENLTLMLNRLEFDLETLERQRLAEEDKQRKLREMLVQTEDMIEFTQRDLKAISMDYSMRDKEITMIRSDYDKVMMLKYQYEDQILLLLQQQLVDQKAESHANKHIQELHQDCRQQDVLTSLAENELAKTLLKIEHELKLIKGNQIKINEEEAIEHERDKEIQNMEMEYTRLVRLIGVKETRVDAINIKVAEIMASSGGVELSHEEQLIKQLEKMIAKHSESIDDLQVLWMREQSHIVILKQQRANQLHQLNIYRKQVLIMDQKYLKLDQEIEKHRRDESNMNRGIHNLNQRLALFNEQCVQRRGYKDSLDNENFVAQNQLICDLKDAEVASLTLLEEMCQLEVDKEELRKELLESQREMMAWEKKVELSAETKHNIEKAKSEGGEIAVMKTEIHRMEVRFAQLRKVQEKLAQDMETCVSRRDGIVDLAYAREKRSTKGAHYTRQQFSRKLDDLKNKIRQINSEIKTTEKAIAASETQLKELNTRVTVENQQMTGLQEAVKIMEAELKEGNLHRQKNLELLVRKQRKARLYTEVKGNRYCMSLKNEGALELETQKQRTINANLISIVESLNTDFPSLDNPLAQILNTLRSPAA